VYGGERRTRTAARDGAAEGLGIEHLSRRTKAGTRTTTAPFTLLIGYYNRNKKEVLDIPIGPENKIEPGGPDQGQPTHFEVGRGWGTIAIKVPKDFGDKKLVWTLTANGKTVSFPFGVVKGYQIEPFLDAAMGNKPPVIKFSETGAALQGPPAPLAQANVINGAVGESVAIKYWITDDGNDEPPTAGLRRGAAAGRRQRPARAGPAVSTTLTKYRGPGEIKFADNTPAIEKEMVNTTATFSLPGRVPHPRRRQRLVRCRRRRVPVLLDDRLHQGRDQTRQYGRQVTRPKNRRSYFQRFPHTPRSITRWVAAFARTRPRRQSWIPLCNP
jgi:hypothetical protein